MSDTQTAKRVPPPYVPFGTLTKILERMEGEGGPPGRVDRSYLSGMSGGYQGQVINALRVLGLIDGEGSPTGALKNLVSNLEDELPGFMQQQVMLLYPEMISLAEQNGTPAQLTGLFRDKFGLSGSTMAGAVRFYIEASKCGGVTLGQHFRPPSRARKVPPGVKKPLPSGVRRQYPAPPAEVSSVGPTASSLRIPLSSGGTIVLTTAVDLMTLSPEDRTFVFSLIDTVKGYSPRRGTTSGTVKEVAEAG